jgi:hypothetical protein
MTNNPPLYSLRQSYAPNVNNLNFNAIVDYNAVFDAVGIEPLEKDITVANSVGVMRLAFGIPHDSACIECHEYNNQTPKFKNANACTDTAKHPIVFTCMNKMTDAIATQLKLRCLGVMRDGELYSINSPLIVTNPEVSGAVNIVCDKSFMTTAGVGDTLYYTFGASEIVFDDLPRQHTVDIFNEPRMPAGTETADDFFKKETNRVEGTALGTSYPLTFDEWKRTNQRIGTILGYNKGENIVRVHLNITQPAYTLI